MILILCFVLLLGFAFLKSLKAKMVLKLPKKFLMANNVSKHLFFSKPLSFLNEESKNLLKEKKVSLFTAKKFDEMLTKLRFHIPLKKTYLSKEEMEIFPCLPVYFLEQISKEDVEIVLLAKNFEDFLPVVREEDKEKIKQFEHAFFVVKKNDKTTMNLVKDLNINYPAKPYKLRSYQNTFQFYENQKVTKMLDQHYLVSKIETKNMCAYLYDFFIGEKVSYLVIENKTTNSQDCAFSYFLDLAKSNLNYLYFKRNKNFTTIQSMFSQKTKYFNYSKSPQKMDFSMCAGLEQSNLPCVRLKYYQTFLPLQKKDFVFMYSKNIVPLKFYSLDVLQQASRDYLKNLFNVELFTKNDQFNLFFNTQLKEKALLELLENGKSKILLSRNHALSLAEQYKQNKINALECYLSIKQSMIEEKENSFVLHPNVFNESFAFVIHINGISKRIMINKKNVDVPCLVMDGVKYFNHFEISKSNLQSNWNISMEF